MIKVIIIGTGSVFVDSVCIILIAGIKFTAILVIPTVKPIASITTVKRIIRGSFDFTLVLPSKAMIIVSNHNLEPADNRQNNIVRQRVAIIVVCIGVGADCKKVMP